MSRPSDVILSPNSGWATGRQNAAIDLRHGAQMGYAPDYANYLGNQAYVRKNLIAILLEAPTGFQLMREPDKWVGTLRALVELHPISIDGFQAMLEVQVEETAPVGGSGEMHQDFTNVTRQRSNPVFRWNEKYGMPVQTFLRSWIRNFMMNEESKVADVATIAGIQKPTDMLADRYSMTCLFLEPDPTHTKVVKSFLCTNMYPMNSGELNARRELQAAGEAVTYDIPFTAITQVGVGVDTMAQAILDSMSIENANPSLRAALIKDIAADVRAINNGYKAGIETLAGSAIKV